jgi:hypothetical protein
LAEPTTTEPDEPPPLSGLAAELDEDELAADAAVDELLLEQAVTAAMPMTANAAIPLFAVILSVIWVSFRTCLIYSVLAC